MSRSILALQAETASQTGIPKPPGMKPYNFLGMLGSLIKAFALTQLIFKLSLGSNSCLISFAMLSCLALFCKDCQSSETKAIARTVCISYALKQHQLFLHKLQAVWRNGWTGGSL